MSHSLNEIEALSKRAARGTGMSWGMSEEAAKAVRWLASHHLPSVELLADLLRQNDNVAHGDVAPKALVGVWEAPSGRLCPIAAGTALNDSADLLTKDTGVAMENVSHPLLAVPFAAWAALHIGAPVAVSWSNVRVCTDGLALWVDGPRGQISATAPTSMSFALADQRPEAGRMPAQRGLVCPSAWEKLSSFAHRTYAPATEQSRRLGAGAGVSDND